jgi:hypothetical protein
MPTTNLSGVKYSLSDAIALEMLELKGASCTLSTIMALLERRGLHLSKATVVKAMLRDTRRFKRLERNEYQFQFHMNGDCP